MGFDPNVLGRYDLAALCAATPPFVTCFFPHIELHQERFVKNSSHLH